MLDTAKIRWLNARSAASRMLEPEGRQKRAWHRDCMPWCQSLGGGSVLTIRSFYGFGAELSSGTHPKGRKQHFEAGKWPGFHPENNALKVQSTSVNKQSRNWKE
jgi:hypothetical protein